jgi:prepilin-type N-terminal cleavage/methylation domain-containing protein
MKIRAALSSFLHRKSRGFSLIEVAVGLGIGGILLTGIWQTVGSTATQREGANLASHAMAVAQAGQMYINANRTTLLALGSLSTINSVARIKITSADTGSTTTNVTDSGYLPSSFVTTNSFGQSYALYVQRQDAGTAGPDSSDKLVGLLITTGGQEISDTLGAKISAGMGAAAGFMFSDDNPAAPTAATTIRGSSGGWKVDLSGTGWTTTVAATATRGHLAIMLPYLPNSPSMGSSSGSGGTSSYSIVQETSFTGSASATVSKSFSTLPASGNTIIVTLAAYDYGSAPAFTGASVTDNQGGTYQLAVGRDETVDAHYSGSYIFYRSSISAPTGTFTVSVNNPARAIIDIKLLEVAGLAASPVDSNGVAYTTHVSPPATLTVTGPGTLAQADNLAVSVLVTDGAYSSSPTITTSSSGWTVTDTLHTDETTTVTGAVARNVISSTTAPSIVWNFSGITTGDGIAAVMATFKIGGGSGGGGSGSDLNSLSDAATDYTTDYNLFMGDQAGAAIASGGQSNTGAGISALSAVTTGDQNTGLGRQAYYGTGSYNTALGYQALQSGTSNTGNHNTAIGALAGSGQQSGSYNTWLGNSSGSTTGGTGSNNVAAGHNSLAASTTTSANNMTCIGVSTCGVSGGTTGGTEDTAIGYQALRYGGASGTGYNTALGSGALSAGTASPPASGVQNTALGYQSMYALSSGSDNTAAGYLSLTNITTGTQNTALGADALKSIQDASYNTAVGRYALGGSATSTATASNTAIGWSASPLMSYGYENTVAGSNALYTSTHGISNVALGYMALNKLNINLAGPNTAIGAYALQNLSTGLRNTAVGTYAGQHLTNGTDNTALGFYALQAATSSSYNTAIGVYAMGNTGIATSSAISDNTAIGNYALRNIQSGVSNVAIGHQVMENANGSYNVAIGDSTTLANAGTQSNNVAIGRYALNNATGDGNVGIGYEAGKSVGAGQRIVAVGYQALRSSSGDDNTAIGYQSLYSANGSATRNTAFGYQAAYSLTSATDVTAIGAQALYGNTGSYNTAIGYQAAYTGSGGYNTAVGYQALGSASGSSYTNSVAVGYQALASVTSGSGNVAVGAYAGYTGNGSAGSAAIDTGSNNTFIGYAAQANSSSATNATALGYGAIATCSNCIVLGNSAITSLYAKVTSITAISDARNKHDIEDLPLGLDFINKLRPRSFSMKNGDNTLRFGLIAQELEQALPEPLRTLAEKNTGGLALILRENNRERTYRVSYGELIAPMVKAIQQVNLKEQAQAEQTKALRAQIDTLEQQFTEQNELMTKLRVRVDNLRARNEQMRIELKTEKEARQQNRTR